MPGQPGGVSRQRPVGAVGDAIGVDAVCDTADVRPRGAEPGQHALGSGDVDREIGLRREGGDPVFLGSVVGPWSTGKRIVSE